MRIHLKHKQGQLFLFIFIYLFFSCNANRDEAPVIPPETSPLSGNYIGYGVITDSFTHITLDPSENSESLGYLRRGSLVKILRRQLHRASGSYVSWVLIDGDQTGWLKEEVMDIYENESQAKTASEQTVK